MSGTIRFETDCGQVLVDAKRLDELEDHEKQLEHLHRCGVDQWAGFGEAMMDYEKEKAILNG